MDNLALSLLASIGMCLIIKYGSIFSKIRKMVEDVWFLKELSTCSLCLGAWTGFIIGLFTPYNPILMAFSSSFLCWFFDHIILLLKEKIWPD